ncbi:MAG: anti-sigma factor [Anaerolineae bacterium]
MTEHAEIEALIPAYAIGAADPEERELIEAHLRQCGRCRALLADYRLLADEMAQAVPLVDAPRHLADDLRRRLAAERRAIPASAPRPRLWRPMAWVGLAATLILLLGTNFYWAMRTRQLSEEVAIQATAIVALAEAPTVTLEGDEPAPNARGVLYLEPDATVAILHVYGLPPLPSDKVYQLWLIRDGQRDSGGLLRVDENGEGVLLVRAPRPLREYQAVGITIEPEGGSPGPTSPRVIGGRM